MLSKRAVVAIGGNALIIDPAHKTIPDQYQAIGETCKHVADMLEHGWQVVITHGNGPQVGFILRRSELAIHELHQVPLDYCVADTQGAIGYMIQKALLNEFQQRQKPIMPPITIITQVLVDQADPAFQQPAKPIGSFLDEAAAQERQAKDGWQMVEDAGRGWRRVVASPTPQRIIELEAIDRLIEQNFVVIAVGGGGIPVIETAAGNLVGVEAVIDKDLASALLAAHLKVDLLLICTGVEKVAINFRQANERWLDRVTLTEAKTYLAEGHFAKGSMGPKIQAVINFLEDGGQEAIVTKAETIIAALAGQTGTRFVKA
jgi:carbamate kinase